MSCIDDEIFDISRVCIRTLEPVKNILPFQDATMGPFTTFGLSILTLEDSAGNIGESPVFSSYNNIMEACLLPILLHSRKIVYKDLYSKLYWSIRNEGFRGQASALLGQVDLALHDLASRRKGMPLHQYLGARRNSVKVYGSGGGTNYSFAELETELGFFLDKGMTYYKMKVGKDFGRKRKEDVERVKFVRSLLGKENLLAIDVNQVWGYEESMRFLDETGEYKLAWLEEPIHSADFDQIGKLCEVSPIPVAYGESERTAKQFPTLVQIGVKHLQPVPNQIAGINEWMEVRDLATKNNLLFSSGGYSFYTAFLLATAGEDAMLEWLRCIMYGLEEYLLTKPEWTVDGEFILSDMPGIPVRIDWEYCEKKSKIIKCRTWDRQNVNTYLPRVSL